MTTDAYDDDYRGPIHWNGYRTAAAIFQFLSWLTTYWLVSYLAQPTTTRGQIITVAIAIALEYGLVKLKSLLFDGSAKTDGAGWAGFVIDAIINAGGMLERVGRLLTWPPIAAILTAVELVPDAPRTQLIGSLTLAAIGGTLLSVLPHRLWRRGEL